MDADFLIPFVFFGFLAAIILVPIYLRERTRQSAHHLIAQALEKGQTLDPALMRPGRLVLSSNGSMPMNSRICVSQRIPMIVHHLIVGRGTPRSFGRTKPAPPVRSVRSANNLETAPSS